MNRSSSSDVNRRKFLRGLGGSAGAISATGTATAELRAESSADDQRVEAVLAAAGDPTVQFEDTTSFENDAGNTVVRTTIRTEAGTLNHVEFGDPEFAPATQFHFERTRPDGVPIEAPGRPDGVDLTLVHVGDAVNVRRTLTGRERDVLCAEIGVDPDEAVAARDETAGLYLVVAAGTDGTEHYEVDIDPIVDDGRTVDPSIDPGDLTVRSSQRTDELVPMGCFDVVPPGPCTKCIGDNSECAPCATTCAGGGGADCIGCLLGCAEVGDSCGCCLDCLGDYGEYC